MVQTLNMGDISTPQCSGQIPHFFTPTLVGSAPTPMVIAAEPAKTAQVEMPGLRWL